MVKRRTGSYVALVAAAVVLCSFTARAHNPYLEGFQESTISSGFYLPTAVRFAPDGRYFVIEKFGRLSVFNSVDSPNGLLVHDFADELWSFHDHGLLGLEVDPEFPTRPYVYIAYTKRGAPGGRVSRIEIDPATNQMVGDEVILLEGWCAVYPSHGMGDLHFSEDGGLYVSYGDGASFNIIDWGQDEPHNADNNPAGPCGCNDPNLEGGALRSQDFETSGDPLGYNGAIIRIDPDTGAAMPDNPLYGGDPGDDRLIAYGLRNPFRFTVSPITGDLFICDVGWNDWEELNRVQSPLTGAVANFGWPCYEGPTPQPGYYYSNLPICDNLYAEQTVTPPFYAYPHLGGASATGAAVYEGGDYPPEYVGALFWADYTAQVIRVMMPDASGDPDPNNILVFADSETPAVDLQTGPNGDLYYADIINGAIKRIRYFELNHPPTAQIDADVVTGPSPLTVNFSAANSFDEDAGDTLTYAWDFNNDGDYTDSTEVAPSYTFPSMGNYPVNLKVYDQGGLYGSDTLLIAVDNGPPNAVIIAPGPTLTWRVGEVIHFSGEAWDPEIGFVNPSTYIWEFRLQHCASLDPPDCHVHTINSVIGQANGAFIAVEHEYPTLLEIRLTATEPGGNGLTDTASVLLSPETVEITLDTAPPGLQASIYSRADAAPWTRMAIINDTTSIGTQSPQIVNDTKYTFDHWSDGGAQAHVITIPDADTTFTAVFVGNARPVLAPVGNRSVEEGMELEFLVSATDPDATTPVLTVTNLPAGATFTDHGDGTGTFAWTPDYGVSGVFGDIRFEAIDADDPDWNDGETISITVNDNNPPPVVASIGNKSVNEGEVLAFTVTANDPDGTIPSLSADNLPSGASFVDNGDGTGAFTWNPGYNKAGVYENVSFTATDTGTPPLSHTRTIQITVLDVNRPPVLGAIGNKTGDENETIQFIVTASDPDDDALMLSASGLPQGASFTDNGDGTAAFSWKPGYTAAGTYNIGVSATDAGSPSLSDTETFSITVNNVNRPPTLAAIADQSIEEGDVLQLSVSASDPDETVPVLTATNLPDGATFTDNGDGTGTLVWQTDFTDAGTYSAVAIRATDAEDIGIVAQRTFSITVANVNRKPVLDTIADIVADETDTIEIPVSATDADGDDIAISAEDLPGGATFEDHGNGTATFRWVTTYATAADSPYAVTFTASDGDMTDRHTVAIMVNNVNRPVSLNPIGDKSGVEGQLISFSVSATDPDGPPSVEAQNLPQGAEIAELQAGIIAFFWTPGFDAAAQSPYSVTFTATDGESQQSETVLISVSDAAEPGSITVNRPKPGQSIARGEKLRIRWLSSGNVGDKVSVELWRDGALVEKIKAGTANDGGFNWEVPAAAPLGGGYSIVVRSKAHLLLSGRSGTFSITK